MQNEDLREERRAIRRDRQRERRLQGNALSGLLFLLAGGALLLRQFNFNLPHWLFTWPMIPLIVGLFIGIQTRFRDFSWLIVSGVGLFFIADDIFPGFDIGRFILPACLILIGLVVIFAPSNKWFGRSSNGETSLDTNSIQPDNPNLLKEDILEIVSVFANVKKMVYSKNFKGGEVIAVFGGADLNLSQADFTGPITIDLVQVFGAAKLIIPPHWELRSEAVAIFGGIEDKRPPQSITSPDKVLILQGTVLFGGIEVRSH